MTTISINFGKFWRCGFYDWRIISISPEGKLKTLDLIGKPDSILHELKHQASASGSSAFDDGFDDLGSLAQGRFIVQTKGMRDLTCHEVMVDF